MLREVSSPERGVVLLDRESSVIYANERAARVLGKSLADLVGCRLPDAIARRPENEDPERVVEEVLENMLGTGSTVHRYSAPVRGADGAVAGRVEVYSDITARRELEKEIVERNSELAELNKQLQDAQEQLIQSERLRTLGEMAAGVAHDINNVLGIILGNAQLARRKIEQDHAAIKCIDAIELAARDAAETVRRLKEIGKPIGATEHQPVDLSEIARDVVSSAIPAWEQSRPDGSPKIAVKTRFEPDCIVMGNAAELREALANILLNAAQSMESGGVMDVATSRDSGAAELTVRDTGVGMSEETRDRLFDPFFTTRGAEGTGLGMSMVYAIATRHRARLIVKSEEGKGTAVTMRFPVSS